MPDRSISQASLFEKVSTGSSGSNSADVDGTQMPPRYFAPRASKGSIDLLTPNYRFRIEEEIGRGRFSSVFRATRSPILTDDQITASQRTRTKDYDLSPVNRTAVSYPNKTNVTVALKIYRSSDQFEKYFADEVKVLSQLFDGQDNGRLDDGIDGHCEHPSLITYYESFTLTTESVRHGVIVYEYYPMNLTSYIAERDDSLTLREIRRICTQLLSGLSYMHARSIVHADVKPENILVDASDPEDLKIRLCDFGSAMRLDEIDSYRVGTVPYLAPELIIGIPYDHKVDIWSFGCSIFEMFCGECLFNVDMYFVDDYTTSASSGSSSEYETETDDLDEGSKQIPLKCSRQSHRPRARGKKPSLPPADDANMSTVPLPSQIFENHSSCSCGNDDDAATSTCTEAYTSDEDCMQGYEWETNHFQLSAFNMLLGRIPHERFREGRYYDFFYNSQGRLRSIPMCVDSRPIREILTKDFEKSENDAADIERFILAMLVYNPDERPDAKTILTHSFLGSPVPQQSLANRSIRARSRSDR